MANILIVEDEKTINDLIMMNLKLVGHTCLQAFDGNEAAAVMDNAQPDLVMSLPAASMLFAVYY